MSKMTMKEFGHCRICNCVVNFKKRDGRSGYYFRENCDKCLRVAIYERQSTVNKMTKGELFDSRKSWHSYRSAIAKDARSVFDINYKPRCCGVCGYDKHVGIAHIKSVSDFDDDVLISEIDDINNLIVLCPNHHWEYDSGLLKL